MSSAPRVTVSALLHRLQDLVQQMTTLVMFGEDASALQIELAQLEDAVARHTELVQERALTAWRQTPRPPAPPGPPVPVERFTLAGRRPTESGDPPALTGRWMQDHAGRPRRKRSRP